MNLQKSTAASAVAATIWMLPLAALAQQQTAPPEAHNTSMGAEYRSVFSDYRPQPDLVLRSWREVNDEMGRLGGHVGHIRQATPAPADAVPAQQAK